MSRIVLTTLGSYGDLHPFLAMARALIGQGHQVVVGCQPEYRSKVERVGAEFFALKPGLEDVGPESEWIDRAFHPVKGTEFIYRKLILPFVESNHRAVNEHAGDARLFINHTLTFGTPIVADKRGIPWISIGLQPSIFFSNEDPAVLGVAPGLSRTPGIGRWYNAAMLRLFRFMARDWPAPVHALRAREGLPPAKGNPLLEGQFSPHGTLALFSAHFAPPARDWPAHTRQVGFPYYDDDGSPEISAETREFLGRGEPPVVFTLGSSVVRMQSDFYDLASQVLENLPYRAIFLVGPERAAAARLKYDRPRIHIADYEPYSRLFPFASAIVHQCGMGTTAQATRSGKPQVLVPFAHDQYDNAERVRRHTGASVVFSRRLSARRLGAALRGSLSDEVLRRAEQLGRRLQAEDFDRSFLDAIAPHLKNA